MLWFPWRHCCAGNTRKKGLISPADFIPIAEETGLIVPLGTWVIEETCRLAQSWSLLREAGIPLSVAVNLSSRQLIQSDLVDTVQRIFSANAFDAARIEFGFEVTETAVMRDPEAAAATLQALRDLGAHISIDDFGTGYSSLAYLKRFPVDTLKVDRSFVMNITDDPVDQAIVRAVTDLAHSMQLTVVAEGVETAEQAQILRHLDVDLLQGFLYARPLPVEQLETLLNSSQCQLVEAVMTEQIYDYDPAETLDSSEAIAVFLADALNTDDAAYIAKAIGVVIRTMDITELAKETGLAREQLYRSFSEKGNPTLKTMLAVMQALGVDLTARPHVPVLRLKVD